MYNVNDILARLQNGENADTIAQEFADALNGAIQKRNEEEEKRKQAAAATRSNKIADLTDILDYILDFIDEYYPELAADLDMEIEASDVEAIVDELDRTIPQVVSLTNSLKSIKTTPSPIVMKATPCAKDFNSIMGDFFKKNNLV
jgi:hypothetical protein